MRLPSVLLRIVMHSKGHIMTHYDVIKGWEFVLSAKKWHHNDAMMQVCIWWLGCVDTIQRGSEFSEEQQEQTGLDNQ